MCDVEGCCSYLVQPYFRFYLHVHKKFLTSAGVVYLVKHWGETQWSIFFLDFRHFFHRLCARVTFPFLSHFAGALWWLTLLVVVAGAFSRPFLLFSPSQIVSNFSSNRVLSLHSSRLPCRHFGLSRMEEVDGQLADEAEIRGMCV